jgi:hypothetical protein
VRFIVGQEIENLIDYNDYAISPTDTSAYFENYFYSN